jgi:hypothetical protein
MKLNRYSGIFLMGFYVLYAFLRIVILVWYQYIHFKKQNIYIIKIFINLKLILWMFNIYWIL